MNKKNRAKQFKKKNKKDKKHLKFNSPHEVKRGYAEGNKPKKQLSEHGNTKTNLRDIKDTSRKASANPSAHMRNQESSTKKPQTLHFKIQKSSQNSLKLTREKFCTGFLNTIKNHFLKWRSFFIW